jgi:hypothetical protein
MGDDRDGQLGGLRFEVENQSPTPTFLSPLIKSTFLHPARGKYVKGTAEYDVREADRHLEPFHARVLSATARNLPESYGSSWFRSYTFRPTRGRSITIRVRNALLEPMSRLRFTFEKLLFRIARKVKKSERITWDDYNAMKRSQDPH